MMLYLASNTRPDISFSVHQCARFTHNTKVSHDTAVKRIGLIRKVLEAIGMENCNGLPTPTKIEASLGTDLNGSEAKRDWPNSYASVIGMMLYLASNTRPDISFSVHQCARFTHNIYEHTR